jgi:hypothetical protein
MRRSDTVNTTMRIYDAFPIAFLIDPNHFRWQATWIKMYHDVENATKTMGLQGDNLDLCSWGLRMQRNAKECR